MAANPQPLQCVRRKMRLLWAVERFKLKRAPGFGPKAGRFGRPAQEQTKIVQRHFGMKETGVWSAALGKKLDQAGCLLYTSDAADDLLCVDLGGRRIITKKNS